MFKLSSISDWGDEMMRAKNLALFGALFSVASLAGCSSGGEGAGEEMAQGPACDRQCLIDLTDHYLTGLAAHDSAGLPFAEGLGFVENNAVLSPGEGLWQTLTRGAGDFALHVPDEAAQTAGWMGIVGWDNKPAILSVALWLEDGEIARVEHRISEIQDAQLPNFEVPRAGLIGELAQDARLERDVLANIGASYYDAVDDNDGTLMPFAEDCERRENGMITAGAAAGQGPASQDIPPIAKDCTGQLSSGVMGYITTIEHRDVFAADPVTGLAMGFSVLAHPMAYEPYPVTSEDGTVTMFTVERFGYEPWDNFAAHIWKVGGDVHVHEIEAMGFRDESEAPTGWEKLAAAD